MDFWKPVALAVIGLGGIGYGLNFDPAHPLCGAAEMHPGQVCQSEARGQTQHRTYEQVVREAATNRMIYPTGGGVLVLGAAAWTLWLRRRETSSTARSAPSTARPDGLGGGTPVRSVTPLQPGVRGPAKGSAPGPNRRPSAASAASASFEPDATRPRFEVGGFGVGGSGSTGPRPAAPRASERGGNPETCPLQSGQVVSGTQIFPRAGFDPEATLPPPPKQAPLPLPNPQLTPAQVEETLVPTWTPVHPRPQERSQVPPPPPDRSQVPTQSQQAPVERPWLGSAQPVHPWMQSHSAPPGAGHAHRPPAGASAWDQGSAGAPQAGGDAVAPPTQQQPRPQSPQPYRPQAPRPEGYPPAP